MKDYFLKSFEKSISTKENCIDKGFDELNQIAEEIFKSINNKGKLLLCGNGGSCADAQHLAAELIVRLRSSHNRNPLPAISLAMDSSTMTACGNDYGFDNIFQRSLEAIGNKNDCLLAISTSGNSKNILLAIKAAKKIGMKVFAFLGGNGGECKKYCDISYVVPSQDTAAIQEVHITIGHALIESVEDKIIDAQLKDQ